MKTKFRIQKTYEEKRNSNNFVLEEEKEEYYWFYSNLRNSILWNKWKAKLKIEPLNSQNYIPLNN